MGSRNIPARSFVTGTTVLSNAINQHITQVSASIDASSWTNSASSVEIKTAFSFDGGASFREMMDNVYPSPPPWPADAGTTSQILLQQTFPGQTPTDFEVTVIVTGPAVTLGPTAINWS